MCVHPWNQRIETETHQDGPLLVQPGAASSAILAGCFARRSNAPNPRSAEFLPGQYRVPTRQTTRTVYSLGEGGERRQTMRIVLGYRFDCCIRNPGFREGRECR